MPQTFMYINKSEKVVWNIASPDPDAVRLLAENLKISDFLAKLLVSKGITDTAGAEDFPQSGRSGGGWLRSPAGGLPILRRGLARRESGGPAPRRRSAYTRGRGCLGRRGWSEPRIPPGRGGVLSDSDRFPGRSCGGSAPPDGAASPAVWERPPG